MKMWEKTRFKMPWKPPTYTREFEFVTSPDLALQVMGKGLLLLLNTEARGDELKKLTRTVMKVLKSLHLFKPSDSLAFLNCYEFLKSIELGFEGDDYDDVMNHCRTQRLNLTRLLFRRSSAARARKAAYKRHK